MEFVKQQFDKLLLSVLLIFAVVVVILLMRWHMENTMITWAQSLATGFSAALLTLITGSRFNPRASDKPPNGETK